MNSLNTNIEEKKGKKKNRKSNIKCGGILGYEDDNNGYWSYDGGGADGIMESAIKDAVAKSIKKHLLSEELQDLKHPEALEPELIRLYEKFRYSENEQEKEALLNQICTIIDNRWR